MSDGEPAADNSEPLYYLRNFHSLIGTVTSLYADLLVQNETDFINSFLDSSIEAQYLYARLMLRAGPLFRSDKVSYAEIPDVSAAAEELRNSGLMSINADYDPELIVPLLLKHELAGLVETPGNKKKETLTSDLLESNDSITINNYCKSLFTIYEPLKIEIVSLLRFLFFGNFYQDLSAFIITELGIVTYESYPLEKEARAFNDRESIDELVLLHNLSEELHGQLSDLSAEEILHYVHVVQSAIQNTGGNAQVLRRHDRLSNTLARQLERIGHPEEAQRIYREVSLPPSRERRARICFTLERFDEAVSICREVIKSPYDEEENDFAEAFLRRILKKQGEDAEPLQSPEVPFYDFFLGDGVPESVENFTLQEFIDSGFTGYYTENHIWNALFALAFWDIIFLPLEGAFYNAYQHGPADLRTERFYLSRRDLIDTRITSISNDRSWAKKMLRRYREKEGTANAFFNWKRVSIDEVKIALNRIPKDHLVAIFSRMVRDLRNNSSGFPDLIVYPPVRVTPGRVTPVRGSPKRSAKQRFINPEEVDSPYLLVEVKGPGDQVQKNQKRWMKVFAKTGIPYRVVRLLLPDI